jgi:hypothetical protein
MRINILDDIYPAMSVLILEQQYKDLYDCKRTENHDVFVIDATKGKSILKEFESILNIS